MEGRNSRTIEVYTANAIQTFTHISLHFIHVSTRYNLLKSFSNYLLDISSWSCYTFSRILTEITNLVKSVHLADQETDNFSYTRKENRFENSLV